MKAPIKTTKKKLWAISKYIQHLATLYIMQKDIKDQVEELYKIVYERTK